MPIPTSWEPRSRPIHELILKLDVLTIAWHRFRQLSFKLHSFDDVARTLYDRMTPEFLEIRKAIFGDDGKCIFKLALKCNAETSSWAISYSKNLINEVMAWMENTKFQVPVRYLHPITDIPSMEDIDLWSAWQDEWKANEEQYKRFVAEGCMLQNGCLLRTRLLSLLSDHDELIPDEIVDRHRLQHLAFQTPEDEARVCQSRLLAMLNECEKSFSNGQIQPKPVEPLATRAGRKLLEARNPKKANLYEIVLMECNSGKKPSQVVEALNANKDVSELAAELQIAIDEKLIDAAKKKKDRDDKKKQNHQTGKKQ